MPHFFQLLQTLDKESTPNGRTFHITRSLKQSLMQRRRSGNRQSTSRRLHQRSVRPTAWPSRNMLSKNSRFLMNECLRFVRYLVNYCTCITISSRLLFCLLFLFITGYPVSWKCLFFLVNFRGMCFHRLESITLFKCLLFVLLFSLDVI